MKIGWTNFENGSAMVNKSAARSRIHSTGLCTAIVKCLWTQLLLMLACVGSTVEAVTIVICV